MTRQTKNVIYVFLDTAVRPYELSIADHEVSRNELKQKIMWQLAVELHDADFVKFDWLPPVAHPGVFGEPVISDDGNSLTVSVLNDSEASAKDWPYLMIVQRGKDFYSSRSASPIKTPKDPIIINK